MSSSENPNFLRDEAIKIGKSARYPEDFELADKIFLEAGVNDLARDSRELAATNIFRGVLQARWNLNFPDHAANQNSLGLAEKNFGLLNRNDQYRVNTIGRASILETLQGKRAKGLKFRHSRRSWQRILRGQMATIF